jgi:hypothetical protein
MVGALRRTNRRTYRTLEPSHLVNAPDVFRYAPIPASMSAAR